MAKVHNEQFISFFNRVILLAEKERAYEMSAELKYNIYHNLNVIYTIKLADTKMLVFPILREFPSLSSHVDTRCSRFLQPHPTGVDGL